MAEREKVIKGLQICSQSKSEHKSCPYYPHNTDDKDCITKLTSDALASLKEQEVHKDGYWIEDAKTYPGAGLSNYVCSNCGKTGGTWIKHIAPGRTFPWCPFCGSNMSREVVKWDD